MPSLSQQIVHWQNIQASLKHIQLLSDSATALLSRDSRIEVRQDGILSKEEQALEDAIEACKHLKSGTIAQIAEESTGRLKRMLQEEQEAEQFETEAMKLLKMATALKQGTKRKFEEFIGDEAIPNADDLNEQLEVTLRVGKKLGPACIRQRRVLKKRSEAIEFQKKCAEAQNPVEQKCEATVQSPEHTASTGSSCFVTLKYGSTIEARRKACSWGTRVSLLDSKQQTPKTNVFVPKLRLSYSTSQRFPRRTGSRTQVEAFSTET